MMQIGLTAIVEADQSVVTFIVCKIVLVHHIEASCRHARAHTAECFQAQAEIRTRGFSQLAGFAATATRNIS